MVESKYGTLDPATQRAREAADVEAVEAMRRRLLV